MCRKNDANAAKQMINLLLLNWFHHKFYCLPICEETLNKTVEQGGRRTVVDDVFTDFCWKLWHGPYVNLTAFVDFQFPVINCVVFDSVLAVYEAQL